jgi:ketosteroid isomerase-like protein
MTRPKLGSAFSSLLLLASLLSPSALLASTPGAAPVTPPSTAEVWQHHIDTWVARDLDGLLDDYAEESVMIVNNRVFVGKSEIRAVFRQLFSIFDRATKHVIDPAIVRGEIVYITWSVTVDGAEHPVGTDTFVIRGGKILYQTIAADHALYAVITDGGSAP